MSETNAHHPSQPYVPPTNNTLNADYGDGAIRPGAPLNLPSGTPVRPNTTADGTNVPSDSIGWLGRWTDRIVGLRSPASVAWLELGLLAFSLVIYGVTRTVGLSRFPIYFFCDEAILVVRAQELLHNGLRDAEGTLLPTYMQNADRWNLGLPVYVHLLGSAAFGTSIVVTRATSATVSLLGAIAVALTLKFVFGSRFWWSSVLIMTVIPAWFLHSRTAFDPVMMAAFYGCFLCAYLLYRYRSPRYLYAAIVFAAATCYSYPNGQAVMLVSAVLLVVSDLRYHLRQSPWLLLGGVLVAAVLAAPLIRFQMQHPGAWQDQLQVINAYVIRSIPIHEKIAMFGQLYAQALNPMYWFFPSEVDWVRHRWYGLGHLGQYLLSFIAIGFGRCLWHWRSSAHRAVLIAVLAAPAGAALYEIAITRALAMVVPATLLACLGLEQVFVWLQRLRRPAQYAPFALSTAAILGVISMGMLRSALVDGPTWYTNYGLYGMQYGAQQVFGAVREELARSPDARLLVSHTWANYPNAFIPFFLDETEQGRVEMTTIEPFMESRREIGAHWIFVMTAPEYAIAQASGKLEVDPPLRMLPYPNGEPGFYFARLRYSHAADAILAAERHVRQQLVQTATTLGGHDVIVRHSQIDLGEIDHLFDGDTETIIRGAEANPLVLEFHFSTPLSIGSISVDGWSPNVDLAVEITPPNGSDPIRFTTSQRSPTPDPRIEFMLPDGPYEADTVRLEIMNAGEGEISKVHVREITFKPEK